MLLLLHATPTPHTLPPTPAPLETRSKHPYALAISPARILDVYFFCAAAKAKNPDALMASLGSQDIPINDRTRTFARELHERAPKKTQQKKVAHCPQTRFSLFCLFFFFDTLLSRLRDPMQGLTKQANQAKLLNKKNRQYELLMEEEEEMYLAAPV